MKMKPEHFGHMKKEIGAVLKKYPNIAFEYEHGLFPRSEVVKDLQRRFCFDLAYGAGLTQFICRDLYPYLNDNHIFTALKRICPTVTRKY